MNRKNHNKHKIWMKTKRESDRLEFGKRTKYQDIHHQRDINTIMRLVLVQQTKNKKTNFWFYGIKNN